MEYMDLNTDCHARAYIRIYNIYGSVEHIDHNHIYNPAFQIHRMPDTSYHDDKMVENTNTNSFVWLYYYNTTGSLDMDSVGTTGSLDMDSVGTTD